MFGGGWGLEGQLGGSQDFEVHVDREGKLAAPPARVVPKREVRV